MNRIHRLVWNTARRLWVPAAETVRARGGSSRSARVGAVVMGVCGLGMAEAGWAACTDDPLVGASADGGSVCTTTSTAYSVTGSGGSTVVLSAGAVGAVLDASSATQINATGVVTGTYVAGGGRLILGDITLNFDGLGQAINVGSNGQLSSPGKLTIRYVGNGWWPAAMGLYMTGSASLNELDIQVNTNGVGAGAPSSDGIHLEFGGRLNVSGGTRVDMSGSRYDINPGLAFYFGGNSAEFGGRLDINSPDAAILLADVPFYGSGTNALAANGGGTVDGGVTALNVIYGASGSLSFKNGALKGGRNAVMIGCGAFATGCGEDAAAFSGSGAVVVNAFELNLNGGSATGPNVLYVQQPESFITLNASNSAVLSGNVVTATDTAGSNTPTDINLSSGATLTGAVMGGGGSEGSEAGDATQRANIALNLANATWTLTDSSNLKTLSNGAGGKVDFGNFSGSYKTLTVKDYAGGGDITFNTFLGDSSSPSDKLIIDGGSATGSSRVWVRNTDGLGAQTTGNGILLVEAINGGSTAPSAFTLGQAVIAGAYDYSLVRAGENWYLSSAIATSPAPPPPPAPAPSPSASPSPSPAPSPTPAPAPLQNHRAESSLYAALPSQALMGMGLALELPTAAPSPPVAVKVAATDANSAMTALTEREQALAEPSTWVRVVGTQAHNRADGQSANGALWAQFKASTELLQAGRRVSQDTQGAASRSVSLVGALGAVSGKVTHTNAAGIASAAGSDKVEMASLGAAFLQRFDAKTYLEAAALLSHLRATSASVRGLGVKTSGTGFAVAVEAGQRLNLNPGWGWQPHATLRVAQANLGHTQDEAGQVRFGGARSAQVGLGVTLQTLSDQATQFHATARLLHEFAGRPGTVLADASGGNGQTFHSSARGSALQLKAGVEQRVGEGSRLFATVNHTQGLNAGNQQSRDTGVSLGAKLSW